MAISNGSAISASDINTATDTPLDDINAYRSHGVSHTINFTGYTGEAAYFTPDDDYELLGYYSMEVEAGNVTVTIDTEDIAGNQNLTPILDLNLAMAHSASAPGSWTFVDMRTTTGDRMFFLKGVTYRLNITSAPTSANGAIALALKAKIRPHYGMVDDGKPYMVKGTTTLTPSIVNSMYSNMDNIARRTRKARFFTHPFNIRFRNVKSTTALGLRSFTFTVPASGSSYAKCDIVGIDIAIEGSANSEEADAYTAYLGQGATVYGSVTFDGPDSSAFSYQTTRLNPGTSDVSTDQEYTIWVTSSATKSRDIDMTVHLRSNVRIGSGAGDASFTYTPVKTGDNVDADDVNTVMTEWQQIGTDLQAQKKVMQIEVYEVVGKDISGGVKWAIPGIANRTLARVELWGSGAAATTLDCDILDEAGAAVGTNPRQLSITGSTSTLDGPTTDNLPSGGVMLSDADLADSADDFSIELSTTTAVTLDRGLAILYWIQDVV